MEANPPPDGLSYRQAVEEALRVLDGDWVVAVLAALAAGPLHNSQLITQINAVEDAVGRRIHAVPLSRQVLAPTLARMVEAGLLVRIEDPTPHPSVWYRLTATGRSLLSALRPLAEWAQSYHQEHPPARPRRTPRRTIGGRQAGGV
jgi:DNA-binding HxlR family transcriptional regulator